MFRLILIILIFIIFPNLKSFAKEAYFQCIHSDESEDMFLYSYDKDKFYVYFDNYKLHYEMDIVNFKNNIIYAERYVPNPALDKMIRYSSVEFNTLTYDMKQRTYGNDIKEKKHLKFDLKCNKFFKMN